MRIRRLSVKKLCFFLLVLCAAAGFLLTEKPENTQAASGSKTKSMIMIKDEKISISFTGGYSRVSWTCDAPSVVSVSRDGRLTAKKKGKAKVTADVDGYHFYYFITVEEPAINHKRITLETGKSKTLAIKKTSVEAKWKSTNSAVASVDANGKVTGREAGDAVVYTYLHNVLFQCHVTVKRPSLSQAVRTGKTENLNETEKKIAAKARKIIQDNIEEDMPDVEKAKVIHDYIILNTAYDEKNLNAGTLPAVSYTIEGVLLRGTAVCQGYAETYQMFMEALSIPCKLVRGRAGGEGHAWNLIKLNGKWYQVDVTFDDPVPDKKGETRYDYFLAPDRIMREDHSWKAADYPACTSMDYYYYVDQEYLVDSVSQYQKKFLEQLRKGKKIITVMYPEKEYPDWDFIWDYTRKWSYYDLQKKGDYYRLTVVIKD